MRYFLLNSMSSKTHIGWFSFFMYIHIHLYTNNLPYELCLMHNELSFRRKNFMNIIFQSLQFSFPEEVWPRKGACPCTPENWHHHPPQARESNADGMGIVELALHHSLRWMALVAEVSSSATAHPHSKSCLSLWKDCPCRTIHAGSPWLRVAPEYPRRVFVRIQGWWCSRNQRLDPGHWLIVINICY